MNQNLDIRDAIKVLEGMRAIAAMLKTNPEIIRLQQSEFYSTSNDLVFGDIELALYEVAEGLEQARIAEEKYYRLNPDLLLEGGTIQNSY